MLQVHGTGSSTNVMGWKEVRPGPLNSTVRMPDMNEIKKREENAMPDMV